MAINAINLFLLTNQLIIKKIIDRKYRWVPINKPAEGILELKRFKR